MKSPEGAPFKVLNQFLRENKSLSFLVIDINGTIVYANANTYERLGYEKEEFYKIPAYSLNPNFTRKQFEEIFEKAQRKHQIVYQTTHKKKDGSHFAIEASLHGLKVEGKEYMVMVSSKVVHINTFQGSLIQEEKKLRNIIDSVPVMMWTTNSKNNFNYFNKTWIDFFGTTMNAEIKGDWLKRMRGIDRSRFKKAYQKAYEKQKTFSLECKIRDKTNKFKWLLFTGVPNLKSNGKFGGMVGSAVDINFSKSIQEKKDEFLSIASHELKNPLTTIKGYTQLLEQAMNQGDHKKTMEYTQKTSIYVEKLDELVSELLDVSRIQAGKLEANISLVNITKLVRNCIDDLNKSLDTNRISVSLKESIYLYGDKLKLEQVLLNLISNAIKYSEIDDKIEVKLEREKDYCCISVKDYGIGIPPKDQAHIFNRFYRTGQSNAKTSGLGIGLYISRKIVELHNGQIEVESQLGKGSTFTVKLPLNLYIPR